MEFKSLDDIEREKLEKERETRKEKIASDIDDVFNRVMRKREEKKKKRGIVKTILLAILTLGLLLLVINFVLGNLWILKFFIKELFKG